MVTQAGSILNDYIGTLPSRRKEASNFQEITIEPTMVDRQNLYGKSDVTQQTRLHWLKIEAGLRSVN
jgi:hypothetical protein